LFQQADGFNGCHAITMPQARVAVTREKLNGDDAGTVVSGF
jgi:hypothetical protein